mgnify:CR=1 FL=1
MKKSLGVFVVSLFGIMVVIGIFLMMPGPIVTVVKEEKSVICEDGICEISVSRLYSDGSGSGTDSTIPQELWTGISESKSCENGYWVTKSEERKEGVIIAVASSITEQKCSQ